MKKVFKITFFVSLAIILLFMFAVIASIVSASNVQSGSVGIIGGADGPTAILITRSLVLKNPLFWVFSLALTAFVVSAIGWCKNRK